MTEQDARDAEATLERIGDAIHRIGRAGYSEIMEALARDARHHRGYVRRDRFPLARARSLMRLADECERLADALDPPSRARE